MKRLNLKYVSIFQQFPFLTYSNIGQAKGIFRFLRITPLKSRPNDLWKFNN